MSKNKPAMNNDHDPLSWLLQDEAEVEEEKAAAASDEDAAETVTEPEPVDDVAATPGSDNEGVEAKASEPTDGGSEESGLTDMETESTATQKAVPEVTGDDSVEEKVETAVTEPAGDEAAQGEVEQIVLQEDVSIIHVAALKESWLPCVDSGKDVCIDAAAVEDIDTAGLQLLLSFVKTVNASGRSVSWKNPSETMVKAVTETALKDVMGIRI